MGAKTRRFPTPTARSAGTRQGGGMDGPDVASCGGIRAGDREGQSLRFQASMAAQRPLEHKHKIAEKFALLTCQREVQTER